jgi:hypothetical protein
MATWTVSTYYKKSCEEHEHYYKGDQTITRKTGFRGATFIVETSDDNPPEFEFDYVPGGDGKLDSINMYDCCVNNIENVELDNMWDGCWEDIEFPDDMDEEEQERLMELFEESSIYEVLEENEGWSQNDTDAWIWGPILIQDQDGNQVKIICADQEGNVVEFREDDDEEITFDELTKVNPADESTVVSSMAAWPFPDIRTNMKLSDKLTKVNESFTINMYDNGYMLEIAGRDGSDNWAAAKVLVQSVDELLDLVKEATQMTRE